MCNSCLVIFSSTSDRSYCSRVGTLDRIFEADIDVSCVIHLVKLKLLFIIIAFRCPCIFGK
jgi:hypothetical protein